MDGRTHGWMDGRTDGRTYEGMNGRMDERTDGRTDGWMDGRTDRRMEGLMYFLCVCMHVCMLRMYILTNYKRGRN